MGEMRTTEATAATTCELQAFRRLYDFEKYANKLEFTSNKQLCIVRAERNVDVNC